MIFLQLEVFLCLQLNKIYIIFLRKTGFTINIIKILNIYAIWYTPTHVMLKYTENGVKLDNIVEVYL